RTVSDDDLRASIAVYNRHRAALRALYESRSEAPWRFPIAEVYPVVRAGNVLTPEEHTAIIADYIALARREDRVEEDRSRVVVAGAFCEQPPLGLLLTLERAGCWIVDDDLLVGLRWLIADVPTDGDPLTQLAAAYLTSSVESASRYQPEGNRGGELVESVRRN